MCSLHVCTVFTQCIYNYKVVTLAAIFYVHIYPFSLTLIVWYIEHKKAATITPIRTYLQSIFMLP